MAGTFNEGRVKPAKRVTPYPPVFEQESDLDFTNPYPCGVCGRAFKSRDALRTHPHPKAARR